jgi:iron complex outermembrane receptor protein
MEEIVITAQKREQSLLDVGISVAVVGEQEIRDRRITMVEDIALFTPNAHVKNVTPGIMPILTVRGVGLNDFNAANNPAIGVYVDDVSLSSLALLSSDLYDLERMEVLKGPQGTLYGRNSTGGALNVVTAKPDLEATSGRISAGVGDYDLTEIEGMYNVPLSDTLALRVAGKLIDQREGYWQNDLTNNDDGERDVWMARAQLLWQPSDRTDVLFKLDQQSARSELGSPNFVGAVPSAVTSNCPGESECSNFVGYSDTTGDIYRGSYSTDPTYNLDQLISALRIDVDLDFATFTSITGYIDFDREYAADVDASPFAILDFYNTDEVQQLSQEFRLSGDTDSMVWQVGLFYTKDEVTTTYRGDLPTLLNTTTFSLGDLESTNTSAFANIEWLLSDTVTLITGIRISDEERNGLVYTDDLATLAPASFLSFTPVGSGPVRLAFIDDTVNDTSVDWKVGVNWSVAEDTLLYASASQGTKSGGFFTGVVTSNPQLIPYDTETLKALEVGVKGKLPDSAFTYEVSAFYYDYEDVQSFIGDNTGLVPVNRLSNIDGATIYGLDLLARWSPQAIEGLQLMVGLGILDTELEPFVASGTTVLRGNEQPDAPKFSSNLAVSYDFNLSDNVSAEVAFDGRYQEETYHSAQNTPLSESDNYWVLNARVSVYFQRDWEISVWGKNIADDPYMTQFSDQLALGNGARVHGAPRTYGITATKHFN